MLVMLRIWLLFTALISECFLQGSFDDARQLFDEIPNRDVVSWNTMILGYSRCGWSGEALDLLREMLRVSAEPDESTLVSILSACAQSGSIEIGIWVDSYIVRLWLRIEA